ncbi:MAG: DUF882 domain-containing protein [Alphaproteobacteria bacterium]|nr:DUF882 domain-containing protein [Alphaproteobacteria bacterium]
MAGASLTAMRAAGSTARAAPAPLTLRRLKLVNAHTGETFEGTYRDDKGPIPRVMDELGVFLRDHHSGATTEIDPGVVDFLAKLMDSVGETRATVLSAYRTRETNEMLARTTFGVAENSQHIYGRALDVYLPSRLAEAMQTARAMKIGGVGWYPHSGFMHIDTGPVRNWTLDERGLGDLLFDGAHVTFHGQVTITPQGELLVKGGHHPLGVSQRLALHRMIARAELLASRHW